MELAAKDRIIVALDVPTLREAHLLAEQLGGYVGAFKVGLELITSEGAPQVVKEMKRFGNVFFDGKFSDIPNTVGNASRAVAQMGVWMFDVHASSGLGSMQAAVQNRGNSLVFAVTVLTSIDMNECVSVFGGFPNTKVIQLAGSAYEAGCNGVICSPKEVGDISKSFNGLLTAVPGVRPRWAATNDQKRIMTPGDAIKAGADYLVIGRPITSPPSETGDSIRAAQLIAEEIDQALAESGR
ncbi:MAG: orotidine-5'-phosphate decarboxylase [Candidatus Magasanikbacteria bacterium]|nr:orotidine-5'-phosphate decarboxylase [Candidatus Magasanikbacteria bacterium]